MQNIVENLDAAAETQMKKHRTDHYKIALSGKCPNRDKESSTLEKLNCVCMNPNAEQVNHGKAGQEPEWMCTIKK